MDNSFILHPLIHAGLFVRGVFALSVCSVPSRCAFFNRTMFAVFIFFVCVQVLVKKTQLFPLKRLVNCSFGYISDNELHTYGHENEC